ncbi:2OG-Fe(II) oxygenase [Myxococcota bacterium]|nr:2OG-Fe(II) oxygenase [Myxococcota bacterium]
MLDALDVLHLVPLLPAAACPAWIQRLEALGFQATGPTYPPDYRDNDRRVFDDPALAADWLARLRPLLPPALRHDGGTWRLHSLNPRFRACRYRDGQAFSLHRDGPWVPDADHRSLLTVMLYLADPEGYEGGETCFWSDGARSLGQGAFRPAAGQALVFAHARWHEGRPVRAGTKWVLRTDVIYRSEGRARARGYLWDVALHHGQPAVAGRDGMVRHAGRTLIGSGGSILRVACLPGALVGSDRQGLLHAWPDDGGPPRRWQAHGGAVLSLRAGTDGLWSTGADGAARRWQGDRLVEEVPGQGWLWDHLPALEDQGPVEARGEVRALARHQGQVARGRVDGRIEHADRAWKAHQGAVRALLSTRWGLVSGGEDGAVRLWRGDPPSADPQELHRHGDFVTGLCAGRSRVWSVGYDGRLRGTRVG